MEICTRRMRRLKNSKCIIAYLSNDILTVVHPRYSFPILAGEKLLAYPTNHTSVSNPSYNPYDNLYTFATLTTPILVPLATTCRPNVQRETLSLCCPFVQPQSTDKHKIVSYNRDIKKLLTVVVLRLDQALAQCQCQKQEGARASRQPHSSSYFSSRAADTYERRNRSHQSESRAATTHDHKRPEKLEGKQARRLNAVQE